MTYRVVRLVVLMLLLSAIARPTVAQPLPADGPPDRDALKKRVQVAMGKLTAARGRLEKIRQDTKAHPPDKLNRDDRYLQARLTFDKIKVVVEDKAQTIGNQLDAVEPMIDRFDRLVTLIEKNKPLERPEAGLHEWAYLARQDGSVQPYYAYVPERAVGKKNVPMLVFLHGYVSFINKVNWLDLSLSKSLTDLADRKGFIVALPFGRSNTEFMGIGEQDVLRVIELMQQRYSIDPRRIVLSGISMGGSGTWTIAAHQPHLFAGIAPVAGRTDYYLWKRLERKTVDRFKQLLTDMNYVSVMPGNFSQVGVYVCHGQRDSLVNVEQSRQMVARLKKQDIPVTYQEIEGGDHWIWDRMFESEAFARWLDGRRSPTHPARIRYTTYSPRWRRAYWATIGRVGTLLEPATLDVEVNDPKTITVRSSNVTALQLDINKEALGLEPGYTIRADGLKRVPGTDDHTVLLTTDGKVPAKGMTKWSDTPGAGPAPDVYNEPFIMVLPKIDNPEQPRDDGLTALMNLRHWMLYARGNPRVLDHTAVRGVDILKHNMVLFGTAESNRQVKRVVEHLPVQIEPGKVTVGKHVFRGDDLGVIVSYPNPLNPKRYVMVHSGTYWGAGLELNHRFDWLPDFIIYNKRIDPDGTNHWLCAGFFDQDWQLDETLMWVRDDDKPEGDPEANQP